MLNELLDKEFGRTRTLVNVGGLEVDELDCGAHMRLRSWFGKSPLIVVVVILVEGERSGMEATLVREGALDFCVIECLQPREAAESFTASGELVR